MEQTMYLIFKYLHIFGAIIGAGAAFTGDFVFLKSHKDKIISRDEFGIIEGISKVVWVGLLLLVVSGAGLLGMKYEVLLASSGFLAKMTIVGVIIINGIFFHYLHIPYIHKHLQHHLFPKRNADGSDFLIFSGVLSVVSWWIVIVISVLKHLLNFTYIQYLALYVTGIIIGCVVSYAVMKSVAHEKELQTLKKASTSLLYVLIFLGLIMLINRTPQTSSPTAIPTVQNTSTSYTLQEVQKHATNEDCWVIVDSQVFDVSKVAAHSGSFHCGADVSVNYHKNHGPVIRPQMLVFKIGELASGTSDAKSDAKSNQEMINPKFVAIAKNISYAPRDLMFIVEKNNASFLVVNGANHEVLGRFEGVGFQPHGIVYSANAQYAYSISRDGWLIKIDIKKLEVVASIKVGESSRGIALSDDGMYVVAGNYEPSDVVIVSTQDMSIVNRVKLERFVDGKNVESRAGVIVEDGNKFIVALKDLNGVWVVDPRNESDVVVKKYWNVGGSPSLLHDGFLTPDGKYFMVAAQDANNVWVLDVTTGEAVTNVPTGIKPHTGPGAYAFNTVYVPSLGEGKITAIEYGTWKVKKYIETAGPGLFARSYNKNPQYPYVWADTAFFDGADEIYVIDSRTQEIVKTLKPIPGKLTIHPEFTYDGKYVYVASSGGNMMVVYDAQTFEEVARFDAFEPSGIFNVGTRIEEPGL